MFLGITLAEWLTIGALLAGPVFAVVVTRIIDKSREVNRRKWELFRTLMRYRRQVLKPEFVGALNLIEVEFHKEKQVIEAWKKLFNHFCQLSTGEKSEQENQMMFEKGQRLTATLLKKIAESLKVEKDTLEFLEGGYNPQVWIDIETEQATLRRLLLEVLASNRAFPVNITNAPNNQSDATSDNS